MDIQIINVDPETNVVSFGIKPKVLTGISKLIQIVVISLLTIPGKDALNPDEGGGLQDLLGSNIDPEDSTSIFSEIARKVKKSETEIISNQVGSNDPPEEKLSEIQIVSIAQGNIDEIFVTLRVVNQVNQASVIVI
ncbi:MAG: hypothetical protein EBZ49_00780 [Proteobacteria bacterium]|nr:hypothetical protein [Pseudomonadota bacterium]